MTTKVLPDVIEKTNKPGTRTGRPGGGNRPQPRPTPTPKPISK